MSRPDAADPGPAPPRCPVPGHGNSRVVLGGRYGKPGRQRQLYVCHRAKPGSTNPFHRFAAPLPRPHAALFPTSPDAGKLDGELDAEELRTARKYQFSAHDIASGLVAVSRGASYASAGQQVREHAARRWGEPASQAANRHGSLVSDWVEVYAEALWLARAPFPDRWPDTVLLGVLPLSAARPGLVFSVFVAIGRDADGHPGVLAIRTANGTGTRQWTAFLRELAGARSGRPSFLVGDGHTALTTSVRTVWPNPDTAPELWVDEHELRERARRICRTHGLDQRERRLWQLLQRAWRDRRDWAAFAGEAERYRLPELDRWLAGAGPVMARQFSGRDAAGSRSRAPVRAVLGELEQRLGSRRTVFGNRARTDRLLLLMALEMSGRAKVHAWAQLICVWLAGGDGPPGHGTTPNK